MNSHADDAIGGEVNYQLDRLFRQLEHRPANYAIQPITATVRVTDCVAVRDYPPLQTARSAGMVALFHWWDTAKNCMVDWQRRHVKATFSQLVKVNRITNRIRKIHLPGWKTDSSPVRLNPDDGEQMGDVIDQVLQQLPLRQRQAFLLRNWQGMSVAETAVAMDCSRGSVKTHLSRALVRLRELLSDQQQEL